MKTTFTHQFLVDLFDVLDVRVDDYLTCDGGVDSSCFFLDPLLHLNLVYNFIYTSYFPGRYPPSLYFNRFSKTITEAGRSKLDLALFTAIVNTPPFTLLKHGHAPHVQKDVISKFTQMVGLIQAGNTSVILEAVYDRWSYRYRIPVTDRNVNMIHGYTRIRRDHKNRGHSPATPDTHVKDQAPMGHLLSDDIIPQDTDQAPETDLVMLRGVETVQFAMMRDVFTCSKFVQSNVVFVDVVVDFEATVRPVLLAMESLQSTCRTILVDATTEGAYRGAATSANQDRQTFSYFHVPDGRLFAHIFPPVAGRFVYMSDTRRPSMASLAVSRTASIYACVGVQREQAIGSSDESRHYDRIVSDRPWPASDHLEKVYKLIDASAHVKADVEMSRCVWGVHLVHHCPFRTRGTTAHNILAFINFVADKWRHVANEFHANPSVAPGGPSRRAVLLVDNRPNLLSVFSIMMSMTRLNRRRESDDEFWSGIVFTSRECVAFYRSRLPRNVQVFTAPELDTTHFSIDTYNTLLKKHEFWLQVSELADTVAVVQEDGIVMKCPDAALAKVMMSFDWLGARWVDVEGNRYLKQCNPHMIGNGGLSIRRVGAMLRVCAEYDREKRMLFYNDSLIIPEDVYFSKYLHRLGSPMPSKEVADAFSSEQILTMTSVGMHKLWAYHDISHVQAYLESCA